MGIYANERLAYAVTDGKSAVDMKSGGGQDGEPQPHFEGKLHRGAPRSVEEAEGGAYAKTEFLACADEDARAKVGGECRFFDDEEARKFEEPMYLERDICARVTACAGKIPCGLKLERLIGGKPKPIRYPCRLPDEKSK